jgi:acyl-CoA thioesterase YciA
VFVKEEIMTVEMPSNENLALRTIAMPADTNPMGDMFGGWMVAQMDLAGGNVASVHAQGRVVTVAIDKVVFHHPIFVGDEVSCYAYLVRVGRTSMTVKIEGWVRRSLTHEIMRVTEGTFVFVGMDPNNHPRPVSPLPEDSVSC